MVCKNCKKFKYTIPPNIGICRTTKITKTIIDTCENFESNYMRTDTEPPQVVKDMFNIINQNKY